MAPYDYSDISFFSDLARRRSLHTLFRLDHADRAISPDPLAIRLARFHHRRAGYRYPRSTTFASLDRYPTPSRDLVARLAYRPGGDMENSGGPTRRTGTTSRAGWRWHCRWPSSRGGGHSGHFPRFRSATSALTFIGSRSPRNMPILAFSIHTPASLIWISVRLLRAPYPEPSISICFSSIGSIATFQFSVFWPPTTLLRTAFSPIPAENGSLSSSQPPAMCSACLPTAAWR